MNTGSLVMMHHFEVWKLGVPHSMRVSLVFLFLIRILFLTSDY